MRTEPAEPAAAVAPAASGSIAPRRDDLRPGASRRSFLRDAAAASAAATVPLPAAGVHAAGGQRLRIGLVGCGGRGTGAALQALAADPAVRVVAVGDMFADQVASAAEVLRRVGADRFDCPPDRRFTGVDAYRRVIDAGVDVVLLAAPPHVRPLHLEAAIAAGKHVYCEKPVAVDVAGVLRAASAADRGRQTGLALVSGFCFRRDPRMKDLVARLHDGGIGRPRNVTAHAVIGLPWRRPAESGGATDDGLRNWISFTTFSGGHLVERHVEAIDRAAWIFGDLAPARVEPLPEPAWAAAVAAAPPEPFGDCPAATAVRYVYTDGRTIEAVIVRREQARDVVVERVVGSSGACDLVQGIVSGPRSWAAPPAGPGRHQAALTALVQGVLTGRTVHDGTAMCRSTLMAVLGGMAAATGRPLAWTDLPAAASGVA